jgi:hypothetical protein
MSCQDKDVKHPPKYNMDEIIERSKGDQREIIIPEPEIPVQKKKFNIVFDLNQSEDFHHKSRILQRFVERDEGEIVPVKVRYKPEIFEAIYVQQGELKDMNGEVRRGPGAGWIIQTPIGGSAFVTEDQFSRFFEIVEEEEGE